MRMAYYPGCSLTSTGVEFDLSTRAVAEKLGIELWEIPDWNCCGASYAHSTSQLLSLALPARNLALAEKEGLDVAVSCAACYNRMKTVSEVVNRSPMIKDQVSRIIELEYNAASKVVSIIEVINEYYGLERLAEQVTWPLRELKVASYYGCLLVRPPELGMDDVENPSLLDRIVRSLGGVPIEWNYKVECCGAFHSTFRPKQGLKIIGDILDDACRSGAECIVVACPLCMLNLDMRQESAKKEKALGKTIPIFYFTELIGLALGIPLKKLGTNKHFVDVLPLLKRKNLQ